MLLCKENNLPYEYGALEEEEKKTHTKTSAFSIQHSTICYIKTIEKFPTNAPEYFES